MFKMKDDKIDNDKKIFVPMRNYNKKDDDEQSIEEAEFDFLFRNKPFFAVGHNCAVEWEKNTHNLESVDWVKTTLIPQYEIDVVKPRKASSEPLETNLDKALSWCDAVNVLRVQHERMEKSYFPNDREYSLLYGLDKKRISKLKKDILILHPGPINRGVEIKSDIVESNNSIILDQVENGVAVRMAIIYLLASKMNISKSHETV